jgi:DNA-binding LytR/AlgR family response regulator
MYSYIIYHDNTISVVDYIQKINLFKDYRCIYNSNNIENILTILLEKKPQIVFIIKNKKNTDISLKVIEESTNFLDYYPYLIVISDTKKFALEAIQNGISDYLLDTNINTLGQSLNRFTKKYKDAVPKTTCIKSYSDYNILKYDEILYLKADNNTTDFKLHNNKIITAFKTLKYFENTLPYYFVRIHKSYIINTRYLSRVHFSRKKCYMNYNEQLPFSNNYREKLDLVLS